MHSHFCWTPRASAWKRGCCALPRGSPTIIVARLSEKRRQPLVESTSPSWARHRMTPLDARTAVLAPSRAGASHPRVNPRGGGAAAWRAGCCHTLLRTEPNPGSRPPPDGACEGKNELQCKRRLPLHGWSDITTTEDHGSFDAQRRRDGFAGAYVGMSCRATLRAGRRRFFCSNAGCLPCSYLPGPARRPAGPIRATHARTGASHSDAPSLRRPRPHFARDPTIVPRQVL